MKYRIIQKPNKKFYIQKKRGKLWFTIIGDDCYSFISETHATNSLATMINKKIAKARGMQVISEYDFSGGELSKAKETGGELSKETP